MPRGKAWGRCGMTWGPPLLPRAAQKRRLPGPCRVAAKAVAKYGDESQFFDLNVRGRRGHGGVGGAASARPHSTADQEAGPGAAQGLAGRNGSAGSLWVWCGRARGARRWAGAGRPAYKPGKQPCAEHRVGQEMRGS